MTLNVDLKVEQEGDIYIVLISGRIDATTTPTVEKRLAKLGDASKLAIDFTNVDYLSSAGMRLLLSLTKQAKAKGSGIAFYNLGDDVSEIIRMAGFERILNIHSNKANALKSLA